MVSKLSNSGNDSASQSATTTSSSPSMSSGLFASVPTNYTMASHEYEPARPSSMTVLDDSWVALKTDAKHRSTQVDLEFDFSDLGDALGYVVARDWPHRNCPNNNPNNNKPTATCQCQCQCQMPTLFACSDTTNVWRFVGQTDGVAFERSKSNSHYCIESTQEDVWSRVEIDLHEQDLRKKLKYLIRRGMAALRRIWHLSCSVVDNKCCS
jgi:hypothetical protein